MSADKGKVSGKMMECPCEGSTLDKLVQPAILTILSDGPLHGYGLAERLSQMPMFRGQKPDGAGIYWLPEGLGRQRPRCLVLGYVATGASPAGVRDDRSR